MPIIDFDTGTWADNPENEWCNSRKIILQDRYADR